MKRFGTTDARVEELKRQAVAYRQASDPANTWKTERDRERAEGQLRAVLAELAALGAIEEKEVTK